MPGTEEERGCLVDVPHRWPHLSPMGDLLGLLIMATLPSSLPLASVQRLQVQVAGCGLADEECCLPIPLKLGLTPTAATLRLEEAPLLRFGLSFDERDRPDLWPLRQELARVRQAFPDMETVQLEVDDDVELELLIPVVDLFVGAGFPNVVVGPDSSPVPE